MGARRPAAAAPAGQALWSAPAAQLPLTHQVDWRDPASGHVWRVWVQRPAGPTPEHGYPTLYVLDGNAAFALAAQLARNEAARPDDMRAGDGLLVVGIGYPGDAVFHPAQRQRDYTPPPPGAQPSPLAGGADALLDFIARQVRPRLADAYPLDPQRQTLSGHSLGGLLVLHGLLSRPGQFTRFAATSPSVWWNGGQVVDAARQFAQAHAAGPRAFQARLQLRVGSLETAQAAPSAARAAVQAERRLLQRTRELAAQLGALQWPELEVDLAVMPGLDHGSAMAAGLIDAVALAHQPRGRSPASAQPAAHD